MAFVQNYSEIKNQSSKSLRAMVRNTALSGFSLAQRFENRKKLFATPRVQFLYIHHVFKDEESKLRQLLSKLSAQHTFISYSNGVERVLSGDIDKPYIAISSDDGFKNNLAAGNILKEFGASACFFINPAMIGEKDPDRIRQFCRQRLNFPAVEFLDWNEVAHLQSQGHEIGSHTMNHVNMATTSAQELEQELSGSFDIITEKCGKPAHFAFPYGRFFHFSDIARKLVFKTGYISCATAERGCHLPGAPVHNEMLALRRDHIILDWSLKHMLYFIARNAGKQTSAIFPY